MRTRIEIGTKVNGSKGMGIITKVITKSTGYVEVNYNGLLKKEMAFNLTNENGESLKSRPVKKDSTPDNSHLYFEKRLTEAYQAEHGRYDLNLSELKNF